MHVMMCVSREGAGSWLMRRRNGGVQGARERCPSACTERSCSSTGRGSRCSSRRTAWTSRWVTLPVGCRDAVAGQLVLVPVESVRWWSGLLWDVPVTQLLLD
jgi:hypothetical protein